MIGGIIFNENMYETRFFQSHLQDCVAKYTDEKTDLCLLSDLQELKIRLKECDLLDLALIDVTTEQGLEAAKEIRKSFPMAEILLVADMTVSPMVYMQPTIKASALLLRPFSSLWESSLTEFFRFLINKYAVEDTSDVLWIDNKGDSFRIPYHEIFYIEARAKKICIRTSREEYCVYGTIEKILQQVPDRFCRCHRSYIVNTEHIAKVEYRDNMIVLYDDLYVPFSRSYRDVIKRLQNE